MLEILTELLGYARKLLPLLELYAGRRSAAPTDSATQQFQHYAADALRANRTDLVELRSAIETLNQRLKLIDDQALELQREVARITERERILLILIVVSALASVGAFVVTLIAIVHR
jgi:hypothetical protein